MNSVTPSFPPRVVSRYCLVSSTRKTRGCIPPARHHSSGTPPSVVPSPPAAASSLPLPGQQTHHKPLSLVPYPARKGAGGGPDPVAPRHEAEADATCARRNIWAARGVRKVQERERSSASQSKCKGTSWPGGHPSSSFPTQRLSCDHFHARRVVSSRLIPRTVPTGASRSTASESAPPDPVLAPAPVCAASPWAAP